MQKTLSNKEMHFTAILHCIYRFYVLGMEIALIFGRMVPKLVLYTRNQGIRWPVGKMSHHLYITNNKQSNNVCLNR